MTPRPEQLTAAISLQIRVELVQHDMQQRDLSEAVGVGPAAINRYLQGHRTIPMETFFAVADTFGMKPSELLGKAEARLPPPTSG